MTCLRNTWTSILPSMHLTEMPQTSVDDSESRIERGNAAMIFCVEDDDSIRDLMVYTMNASGFKAKGFAEGTSFWEALKDERPQLVMLDIMLPGENGIEILKKLRSSPTSFDIPVIMASAKGSEYDKVVGLDLGADDYLSKPFGMMEMLSRIRAVLRRSSPRIYHSVLTHGAITMDDAQHVVMSDSQEVTLTLKEYELLKLLLEKPHQVFTRTELLTAVWGEEHSDETRTVDVHINTLRAKLGESGSAIQTVRGVGYRMRQNNNRATERNKSKI